MTPDIMVCNNGGDRCYKTVQEAVNAALANGTKRFAIYIKEEVYEEKER